MVSQNRVAVYARVSTDEQAEAATIENQTEFANRYCDLHSLTVAGFYLDDGVSGTIPLPERPEGARLLADAKAGKFDLALVYRVDRLARRLRVLLDSYEALEALGVGLRSMTEPIDTTNAIGRFIFQLLGSIAELERETILERTIMGTNRRAAQGKWLGGIVPFGYRLNQGFLEVNDDKLPGLDLSEADVVRLCYRLVVDSKWSAVQIADHLNALGVPTSYVKDGLAGRRRRRVSGLWTPSRIYAMLVEPIYRGVHYYGRHAKKPREIIERQMPAIVSPEVWEAARRQLSTNRIMLSCQNAKRDYLLRGLIKCAICGLTYVGGAGLGRHPSYYRCTGQTRYRGRLDGRCPSRRVQADQIEQVVWSDICRFIADPGEVLEQMQRQLSSQVKDKRAIEVDAERLDKAVAKKAREREVIVRLLREEKISYQEAETHLQEIARETETLNRQRGELFVQMQSTIEQETALLNAQMLLEGLQHTVVDPDFATKRRLVETLVEGITVETESRGRHGHVKVNIRYRFDGADNHTGRC